jgi:hypothetical protein
MAGKKWSLWRRFKALSLWRKISYIFSLILVLLGIWKIYLVYYPPKIQLQEAQKTEIEKFGGDPLEIEKLMQAIQNERNKAINDSVQIEFIQVISNIYKTIDSLTTITINETFVDSVSGQKYRNDITIRKNILGAEIKFLLRLNPYNNPTEELEIKSFQKHIEAFKASKGIFITKGKYRRDAIKLCEEWSIEHATFKSSKDSEWNKKITVPVLVKLFKPKIQNVSFTFKAEQDNPSLSVKNGNLSIFLGKERKSLMELFVTAWNDNNIELAEKKIDSIIFEGKNISLEIVNGKPVSLDNIKFYYQVNSEYRFQYLMPVQYTELLNDVDNSRIYGQYKFDHSAFFDNPNWSYISNVSDILKKSPKTLNILASEKLEDNAFQMDFEKGIKITKND